MGFPARRLGQDGTPKGSADPGCPGISGADHPPCDRQAPVALASSTLTPGPIVEDTDTFFR
jgi:hypothetical protein